jgi:diacylglycerol kinase family enzyme
MIGSEERGGNGPNGSTCGTGGPITLGTVPGFLLVNPRSGDQSPTAADLEREARRRGVEVHVLDPDDDVEAIAREAQAEAVGMAGGDGSLAPVAAVALDRELPFVCIPFGTRNHFARDLGLDRDDPIGALAAFDGTERRVDVGEVGDRLFLNNVSLGLYARLVHRRERHRRREQALAGVRALGLVASERHGLHVRVDGVPLSVRILLVASNAYELDLFELGERERLDAGELHVYAAHGWLPRHWSERVGQSFRVETDDGPLEAAVDGEPEELASPLEFRIRPQALRVLVPPR